MTDIAEEQIGAPAEDAAAPESSAPNLVRLASGHLVTLAPKVTIPIGIAGLSVIKQGGGQAAVEAGLAEVYLRLGIVDWTFRDADGKPEPITPDNIERLLPYGDGGLEVAEAADGLYSEEVMRPLLRRLRMLSSPGPTVDSTPPIRPSGSTPPKPSLPSSPVSFGAGKRSGVPAL